VCTDCHKKLTSMYLSNKFKKEGENNSKALINA
jgi:hypothetical protein